MDEEIVMSYLAGVLDGDGSFSIIKRTACMKSENRKFPRYKPCIQLYNLSEKIVLLLEKHLGGNTGKRKGQKENWKPQVYWYCTGLKKCKFALEKIIPFLVIKKNVAELLFKFVEKGLSLYGQKNICDSTILDREKDYIKIRSMNDERDVESESLDRKSHFISKKESHWAYIAGLMDTDGCFLITRSIRPKKKSYSYEAKATIQMLSIKGINFLYKTHGLGKVTLIKKSKRWNARQNFIYRWSLTKHSDLKIFLKNVLPYLNEKKDQAIMLLQYIEDYKKKNRYDKEGSLIQEKLREAYFLKIRSLKNCEVNKPSLIDVEVRKQDDMAQAGQPCSVND